MRDTWYYTTGTMTSIPATHPLRLPVDLEQVILARGPSVLQRLVSDAGGVVRAARICGISRVAVARWTNCPVGETFGRATTGDHSAIWMGYPNPWPALDRVTEQLTTPPISFLTALERAKPGIVRATCAGRDRIGLHQLRLPPDQISSAAAIVGIPRTSARRLISGVEYPRQWMALDRLSLSVARLSWLELVLDTDPQRLRRPAPAGALGVLLEHAGLSPYSMHAR